MHDGSRVRLPRPVFPISASNGVARVQPLYFRGAGSVCSSYTGPWMQSWQSARSQRCSSIVAIRNVSQPESRLVSSVEHPKVASSAPSEHPLVDGRSSLVAQSENLLRSRKARRNRCSPIGAGIFTAATDSERDKRGQH